MAPRAKSRDKQPAPRAWRHLTIGVGLVNFEVGIKPLIGSDSAPAGSTLCGEHHEPVKQAWRCEVGDHYVPRADTVYAYEHPDAGYVQVDRDALAAEKSGRVDLEAFVDASEIDPLYYEKPYTIWPAEGGGAAFDLIATVLRSGNKALVGKTVLTKSTRMLVLRWSEAAGTILAYLCQHDANVKWDDIALVRTSQESRSLPDATQVGMAETLLASLPGEFQPISDDDYLVALQAAIDAAAEGREPPTTTAPAAAGPADLMAALTASVAAAQEKVAA